MFCNNLGGTQAEASLESDNDSFESTSVPLMVIARNSFRSIISDVSLGVDASLEPKRLLRNQGDVSSKSLLLHDGVPSIHSDNIFQVPKRRLVSSLLLSDPSYNISYEEGKFDDLSVKWEGREEKYDAIYGKKDTAIVDVKALLKEDDKIDEVSFELNKKGKSEKSSFWSVKVFQLKLPGRKTFTDIESPDDRVEIAPLISSSGKEKQRSRRTFFSTLPRRIHFPAFNESVRNEEAVSDIASHEKKEQSNVTFARQALRSRSLENFNAQRNILETREVDNKLLSNLSNPDSTWIDSGSDPEVTFTVAKEGLSAADSANEYMPSSNQSFKRFIGNGISSLRNLAHLSKDTLHTQDEKQNLTTDKIGVLDPVAIPMNAIPSIQSDVANNSRAEELKSQENVEILSQKKSNISKKAVTLVADSDSDSFISSSRHDNQALILDWEKRSSSSIETNSEVSNANLDNRSKCSAETQLENRNMNDDIRKNSGPEKTSENQSINNGVPESEDHLSYDSSLDSKVDTILGENALGSRDSKVDYTLSGACSSEPISSVVSYHSQRSLDFEKFNEGKEDKLVLACSLTESAGLKLNELLQENEGDENPTVESPLASGIFEKLKQFTNLNVGYHRNLIRLTEANQGQSILQGSQESDHLTDEFDNESLICGSCLDASITSNSKEKDDKAKDLEDNITAIPSPWTENIEEAGSNIELKEEIMPQLSTDSMKSDLDEKKSDLHHLLIEHPEHPDLPQTLDYPKSDIIEKSNDSLLDKDDVMGDSAFKTGPIDIPRLMVGTTSNPEVICIETDSCKSFSSSMSGLSFKDLEIKKAARVIDINSVYRSDISGKYSSVIDVDSVHRSETSDKYSSLESEFDTAINAENLNETTKDVTVGRNIESQILIEVALNGSELQILDEELKLQNSPIKSCHDNACKFDNEEFKQDNSCTVVKQIIKNQKRDCIHECDPTIVKVSEATNYESDGILCNVSTIGTDSIQITGEGFEKEIVPSHHVLKQSPIIDSNNSTEVKQSNPASDSDTLEESTGSNYSSNTTSGFSESSYHDNSFSTSTFDSERTFSQRNTSESDSEADDGVILKEKADLENQNYFSKSSISQPTNLSDLTSSRFTLEKIAHLMRQNPGLENPLLSAPEESEARVDHEDHISLTIPLTLKNKKTDDVDENLDDFPDEFDEENQGLKIDGFNRKCQTSCKKLICLTSFVFLFLLVMLSITLGVVFSRRRIPSINATIDINLTPTVAPTSSFEGKEWNQLGDAFEGVDLRDQAGFSVMISTDGRTVAMGARRSSADGMLNRGSVKIYRLEFNRWYLIGELHGNVIRNQFGFSLAISENGNRVAIGSVGSDTNGKNSGMVEIFEFLYGAWNKIGEFHGKNAGDIFGTSVSITSDGRLLAIGAPYRSASAGRERIGEVYFFEDIGFDTPRWVETRQRIAGAAANGFFGWSVSLSSDGTRVAIGAPLDGNVQDPGFVQMYIFTGMDGQWTKLGNKLENGENGDRFGYSVSMDRTGTQVAIGAIRGSNEEGYLTGLVKVFRIHNQVWSSIGQTLTGKSEFSNFGLSVSLSSGGDFLAIGAPNQENYPGSGMVNVYALSHNYSWVSSKPIISDIDESSLGFSVSLTTARMIVGLPTLNEARVYVSDLLDR
jgi:hypothetical protein